MFSYMTSAHFQYTVSPRGQAKNLMQIVAATMALLLVCLPLFSQASQSAIQGAVLDQSGGSIAGAAVTVIDVARGSTRALVTDSARQLYA